MIYSGSATRTPSLPYSTPRVPNSRVTSLDQQSSLLGGENLTPRRLHFIRYKAKYRVLTQREEPTQHRHNTNLTQAQHKPNNKPTPTQHQHHIVFDDTR